MTAPPWPPHPGGPFPHVQNQNVASDQAHVEQQIGAIHGNTTFHRYQAVYHINQNDPPQQKFKVARNHLRGGTPRFAEEILGDLMRNGYESTEVAYHYVLSLISGRSLNEIDKTVYHAFIGAFRTVKRLPADKWTTALEMVRRLMSLVWRQERTDGGVLDAGSIQDAMSRFTSLPPRRQAEIKRHLDMILSGAIQDHLDTVDDRRVATERMGGGRAERAWKFFEPDPAAPRVFVPYPTRIEPSTWAMAWIGGGFALVGLFSAMATLGNVNVGATVVGLLAVLGGGLLGARYGIERLLTEKRLARTNFEHGLPFRPANPNSPGHWVPTAFVQEVHQRVEDRFRDARPHIAGDWEGATRGIKEYLKDRFVALYGNAQVIPGAVDWLIRWHARRVAARWRDGTLFAYRATLVPSSTTNLLLGLGIGIAVIGVFAMTGAGGVGAAFAIGVGGGFGLYGIAEIMATRQHDRMMVVDNERLAEEEVRAYHEWVAVLTDRPLDGEMADWLALDVLHLKSNALRKCGMSNRDLVSHVVLTDGAPEARRARVAHGPVRYSAYVVMVFLLTKGGVREVEVDLDFLDGNLHDERRVSFRYDTLASARVEEVGIRYANDVRYVVDPRDPAAQFGGAQMLRSRAFRLSLLDGKNITTIVENFDGLTDVSEDPSRLLRMALDTSGITGALHILEAVAAEGRDWIAREQERRDRRSEEWQDGYRGPDLLEADIDRLFAAGSES